MTVVFPGEAAASSKILSLQTHLCKCFHQGNPGGFEVLKKDGVDQMTSKFPSRSSILCAYYNDQHFDVLSETFQITFEYAILKSITLPFV